MDRKDMSISPSIEDIYSFVRNPLLKDFCLKMEQQYQAEPKMEFSRCSWEYGWNVKFKKSGKNLCTVYPRENYFTVLVVIGQAEKEEAEALLPELSAELQSIYGQCQEGNGQRWLMIDMEDDDRKYQDVWKLIQIRRKKASGSFSKLW